MSIFGFSKRSHRDLTKRHSTLQQEHQVLQDAYKAELEETLRREQKLTKDVTALQLELTVNNARLRRDRVEMEELRANANLAAQREAELQEVRTELEKARFEFSEKRLADQIALETTTKELGLVRVELETALGLDEAEKASGAQSRLVHERRESALGHSVEESVSRMAELQLENKRLRQELTQARSDMHKLEALRVDFIELSTSLLLAANKPHAGGAPGAGGAAVGPGITGLVPGGQPTSGDASDEGRLVGRGDSSSKMSSFKPAPEPDIFSLPNQVMPSGT